MHDHRSTGIVVELLVNYKLLLINYNLFNWLRGVKYPNGTYSGILGLLQQNKAGIKEFN